MEVINTQNTLVSFFESEWFLPINREKHWKEHAIFLWKYFANNQHSEEAHLYRNSFAYRLQACRGAHLRWSDGENVVDIGFKRDWKEVVFVWPIGPNIYLKVAQLAKKLEQACWILACVKKVTKRESELYEMNWFEKLDYERDFSETDKPDDVFPEIILDMNSDNKNKISCFDPWNNSWDKNVRMRNRWRKFNQLGEIARTDLWMRYLPQTLTSWPLPDNFADPDVFTEKINIEEVRNFLQNRAQTVSNRYWMKPHEYYECYEPFLYHLKNIWKWVITIARDPLKSKTIGVLLATELSPNSYWVVMNLADTEYRWLAESLVLEATDYIYGSINTFKTPRDTVMSLNLWGSESDSLNLFKTRFPNHSTQNMYYMRYKW